MQAVDCLNQFERPATAFAIQDGVACNVQVNVIDLIPSPNPKTLTHLTVTLILRHGRVAKYCDEYVCLSVRWHNSKTARPNFNEFFCVLLPVAVSRSSSDGVAIHVMYFRFYG